MSADMSIHALDHLDEEAFKCFFSNEIGSSYEDALYTCPEERRTPPAAPTGRP